MHLKDQKSMCIILMYQNNYNRQPPHQMMSQSIGQNPPLNPYNYNPPRNQQYYPNQHQQFDQPYQNPTYPYHNQQNQNLSQNDRYSPYNEDTYPEEIVQYRGEDDQMEDQYHSGEGLYSNSRTGFIQKVYTILSLQLIVTALVCIWGMNSETFKNTFVNTPMIIVLSVLLMVVSFAIACCWQALRPYGLIVLIVFTLIFALFVGIVCSLSKPDIVATAAIITGVLVIGLTIFACVTKTDFTTCGPYLFVVCMVLLCFGIVLIFWHNKVAHLIYACLAALLFSVYLIFDTQLVLGKGRYSYSLDDAYLAAIQLYIDIVEIFLQILQILTFADG